MTPVVNLNADVGESFGRWRLGEDEALIELLPTVNVACGAHAGDPHVMRRTVEIAARHETEVGAHVGLPDLVGFGRRTIDISSNELWDMTVGQVGALAAFSRAAGIGLTHVKPHGSLYAMCACSGKLADALLRGVAAVDDQLLVILGGPHAAAAGMRVGVRVVPESYVDLELNDDGLPVIEREKQAWAPAEVARRAIRLARDHVAVSASQRRLEIHVPTICLHGDSPNAAEVARAVTAGLPDAGVRVASLTEAATAWTSASSEP